ncbi:MAG: YIP1 family protein [bacterium]
MSFRKHRFKNDNFAWMQRNEKGTVTALFDTTKEIIINPKKFFRKLNPAGDLKNDLFYAAIMGSIPAIIFFIIFTILSIYGVSGWAQTYASTTGLNFNSIFNGFFITIFTPLQVVIGLLFGGAIVHLFLRFIGWKGAPFAGTIRVFSYSTAAGLIAIFPLLGGIIGAIWGIALQVTGLKATHKLTTGKALLAIFSPLLITFILSAGAVTLFVIFSGLIF